MSCILADVEMAMSTSSLQALQCISLLCHCGCVGRAPGAAVATSGRATSEAGGVTEVSVTSGGCRLVRQAAVRLQRAGTVSSEFCRLQLPSQLARALLCEDMRSGYTLVGESGYQQPVEFKDDGCVSTGRGFTKFRRATGIPPLSRVLVAACDNDPGHLHVAMDPAAQQPDTAMAGAMGDTPAVNASILLPQAQACTCCQCALYTIYLLIRLYVHSHHVTPDHLP
jgi:hypothetical protein